MDFLKKLEEEIIESLPKVALWGEEFGVVPLDATLLRKASALAKQEAEKREEFTRPLSRDLTPEEINEFRTEVESLDFFKKSDLIDFAAIKTLYDKNVTSTYIMLIEAYVAASMLYYNGKTLDIEYLFRVGNLLSNTQYRPLIVKIIEAGKGDSKKKD